MAPWDALLNGQPAVKRGDKAGYQKTAKACSVTAILRSEYRWLQDRLREILMHALPVSPTLWRN